MENPTLAELKTKQNDASVEDFLAGVAHDRRREDSLALLDLFKRLTGEPPKMWGSSIIGFGTYEYRYASGRTGAWPRVGFSPRKQSLTIYAMPGFSNREELLGRLGKHRTGRSCLYINKLADVDMAVLAEIVESSLETMRERYPE